MSIYDVNYSNVADNLLPPNKRKPRYKAWLTALLYALQWLRNNFFNEYADGSTAGFFNPNIFYDIGERVIDTDNGVYECMVRQYGQYPHLNTDPGNANKIKNIIATNIGSGYTTATVTITGDGVGATAIANVEFGTIDSYTITNPGTGYTTATVTITGDGVDAAASAQVWGWWQKITDNYIGVRERTKYNGQKLTLEYALNKWFRTTFRQPPLVPDIYIENLELKNSVFIIGSLEDVSSSIYSQDNYVVDFIQNEYTFGGNSFTIWVPIGIYNSIATTDAERNAIIRAFADKYVIAGVFYNIDTY